MDMRCRRVKTASGEAMRNNDSKATLQKVQKSVKIDKETVTHELYTEL